MHHTRTKIIVAVAATAVVVGGIAQGRHLLAGGPEAASSHTAVGALSPGAAGTSKGVASGSSRQAFGASGPAASGSRDAPGAPSPTSGRGSALAAVPAFAVRPQVVHTATIDMRVGTGQLVPVLRRLTALAAAEGGYVDSSSLSGGTTRRPPVAGTMAIRVLDADFADAVAQVGSLGTVEDQRIRGQDVTIQVAQNAASIAVLQDEVNLLEKKLGEATDIGTFLQIQNQLFPVEQQLQQLQSAQAVLENSAALATITVGLSAPGAPVVTTPRPKPAADAATVAWRSLRHNTLAVLDGLAVAVGWALPVLVPLALVGVIALRMIRRRHAVTPA